MPTPDATAGPDELVALYRDPHHGGRVRLPWSWSTLTPPQRHALAGLVDRFVAGYNREWATDAAATIPPCWYRHPALARDLAALVWAHHAAYHDAAAVPELALRFQDHLPRFADRLDRWLGPDPQACRAGRHPVHRPGATTAPPPRTSQESLDAITLLGDHAP